MSKKLRYIGAESKNIGQYGMIEPGDVINFNDQEAAAIEDGKSPEFIEHREGYELPKSHPFHAELKRREEAKKEMTPEERAAVEADELARTEKLDALNNAERVEVQDLMGKTNEELALMINQMRDYGFKIDEGPRDGRNKMIAAIVRAVRSKNQPGARREEAPAPVNDNAPKNPVDLHKAEHPEPVQPPADDKAPVRLDDENTVRDPQPVPATPVPAVSTATPDVGNVIAPTPEPAPVAEPAKGSDKPAGTGRTNSRRG